MVTLEIIEGPDYEINDQGWEHHAYTLRLRHEGRTMDIPWRAGLGITDDPEIADVLEALASDASSADQDFEDWAGDYGYDTDSRRAYAIYEQVQEQTNKLRELLGEQYDSVIATEWS